MKRGVRWAFLAYLVQIPVVVGFAMGWFSVHPIVLMLPLVGLLNGKVEERGREGLGLILARPARSLLLALLWAVLSFGRYLVVPWLEGASPASLPLSAGTVRGLAWDFAVDVFIIALWEEVVSRGYIQTRLQEAWGFWGVIVATLLFASLHLPSALLASAWDPSAALYRFVQTGLAGFLLGYVYWRTGSVLTTIAVHGLGNFALSVSLRMTGLTEASLLAAQRPLQLLGTAGQVGAVILLCQALFPTTLPLGRTGTATGGGSPGGGPGRGAAAVVAPPAGRPPGTQPAGPARADPGVHRSGAVGDGPDGAQRHLPPNPQSAARVSLEQSTRGQPAEAARKEK